MTDPTGAAPKHITVAGDLGSGKSSVTKVLADRLDSQLVSTGQIQRSIADRLQLSTLATNLLAETNREIDTEVDGVTTRLSQDATEPIVFDSRMAWHLVARSLRVRLIVDPEVAVNRILGREASSVEAYSDLQQARENVRARYESENRRFLHRYGVDITSLKNYDLVIDTSDASIDQVCDLILSRYHTDDDQAIFASPRRLIPTGRWTPTGPEARDASPPDMMPVPQVAYAKPFLYTLDSHQSQAAAVRSGTGLLRVDLQSESLAFGQADTPDRSHPDVHESTLVAWEAALGLDFGAFRLWRPLAA
jgi:CMP/dCMP kinase